MGRAARPGPGHSTHYLLSRFLFITLRVHQSISIYDREIGAKISVSVSISRFLSVDNVLYLRIPLSRGKALSKVAVAARELIILTV